jgi:hypothetical protein
MPSQVSQKVAAKQVDLLYQQISFSPLITVTVSLLIFLFYQTSLIKGPCGSG